MTIKSGHPKIAYIYWRFWMKMHMGAQAKKQALQFWWKSLRFLNDFELFLLFFGSFLSSCSKFVKRHVTVTLWGFRVLNSVAFFVFLIEMCPFFNEKTWFFCKFLKQRYSVTSFLIGFWTFFVMFFHDLWLKKTMIFRPLFRTIHRRGPCWNWTSVCRSGSKKCMIFACFLHAFCMLFCTHFYLISSFLLRFLLCFFDWKSA